MSNEPESTIGDLFAQLPLPDPAVTEEALSRTLAALPARRRRPERSARAFVLVLAAAVALLAVGAGALAAAGALHVRFGAVQQTERRDTAAPSRLLVPGGANGIAATVDGRLWLTTSSGLRLQGLPVSAAALSPHARYVAVGIGHALVAMAPDGQRAWSHAAPGTVVAIRWAPDGLRIAYVVAQRGRFRLYAIEGNGGKNQLVDAAVRSTRPAWRADSLAIAYVTAGGRAAVYDLGHTSHSVVAPALAGNAILLAFAPRGGLLAFATRHDVVVAGPAVRARATTFSRAVAGLDWLGNRVAVALNGQTSSVRVFHVARDGALVQVGPALASARIEALDALGSRLALATRSGIRMLPASLTTSQSLLRLHPESRVGMLDTR